MEFLRRLLSSKNATCATCKITKEPIGEGYGYLLTTAQIVASEKYWDMIMTNPETMSYSISHFSNQIAGTEMRSMIFEKHAAIEEPWMVSHSVIGYFDVDRKEAREKAKEWWESDGCYKPEKAGHALTHLDPKMYQAYKDYAILEAGRKHVQQYCTDLSSIFR